MQEAEKPPAPSFTAADLDGLTIGEAFQTFVIKDPEVQAMRGAVVAEDSIHREVFDEGRKPGLWGRFHWPVDVTADTLISAFGYTRILAVGDYSRDLPPSPAVQRAAAVIGDRCGIFFGLLRQGAAVATGTYVVTGIDGPLNKAVWSRKGASVDIETSDFIDDVTGKDAVRWSGLVLSAVAQPAVSVPAITSVPAEHEPLRSSAKAELDCWRWLTELARSNPAENPMGNKDEPLKVAQKQFPGLSKRAFDRVWGLVMLETGAKWNLPGRPKKSSQQNLRTN
jgi:hypothetical protein